MCSISNPKISLQPGFLLARVPRIEDWSSSSHSSEDYIRTSCDVDDGGSECGGRETTTTSIMPYSEGTSSSSSGTTINHLYPEIMTEIFLKLSLKDLGSAARTSKYWNSILNDKRLWRGVEAKINVSKGGNQMLFQSLHRRGIFDIQVLSLKRSLREMTSSLPGIRSLKLSGCYNVTDGTISSGFSIRLENLTVLNLSLCKQVSDFSLGRIAMMAVNLESLDLGGCCQISNRGLLMVSWGLKKLTKLNLRSCYLITDTGIGFLAGVVSQSHLQEPRMHDFLLKFGLVDVPEIDEDFDDPGPIRRRKLPSHKKQQQPQFLFLQAPSSQILGSSSAMGITNKKDNTSLPVPITQQCAICKQEIKLKIVNEPHQSVSHLMKSKSSKRFRQVQIVPNPRTSNNVVSSNNNNCLSNPPSPISQLSSSRKKSKYVIVEKITARTEFGNTQLQQLILQDCQKLSDDCLIHLTNLCRLEAINLSFCVHITDSGLRNLGACPALCEINLRACDNITDSGLANLTYDLSSRVTSLDVSFCDKVHNLGLNYISQFSHLRTLSMSACDISDEGLIRVAASLPLLETLNIGQCGSITDASLKVIGEKCQELKYIDLYGCGKITPGGLAHAMKLPKLRNLNLGLWHLR
ncbi:unnamed protein product [Allacma fusca]|uniref:F-box domain-containing protein n=1 Tax=Allacma fusca TaxID=39272 RepID=A0A8J2PUM7_9HEXA|nr:unnamed protein product [Allacma fusca]